MNIIATAKVFIVGGKFADQKELILGY